MKSYTGINIQYPISQLILSCEKTVETRTYDLPERFLNKELLIVETPGKSGKFKSRIVGIIVFSKTFQYASKKSFYEDKKRHFVEEGSVWAWKNKAKWGWEIKYVKKFTSPKPLNKRPGIVYTTSIEI